MHVSGGGVEKYTPLSYIYTHCMGLAYHALTSVCRREEYNVLHGKR